MSAAVLAPLLQSCRTALPAQDAARAQAFARALARGLPGQHDEDWKYSDPAPLVQRQFVPAGAGQTDPAPWLLPGHDGHRLVFVNGRYAPGLSQVAVLPAGARLDAVSRTQTRATETTDGFGSAFTDLNLALHTDGAVLELAPGVTLEVPVHVLYLHTGSGMAHVRNILRLNQNSRAQVIEHYAGADGEYFCNAVTDIQLAEGAQLAHHRLQQHAAQGLHVGSLHVAQARDSHLRVHSTDLGGSWVRNDLFAALAAPGAAIRLDGLYMPFDRQHIDNHTRIDHRQPQCVSRESFKGILDGHGRGVFNGKIVVHRDAQKTDSEQSSRALLLSRSAEVDAKPELEIYADDVKCKHGATVGQLDEDALFYLRSRGLDRPAAHSLLTYSFAEEMLGQIPYEPLRRHIEAAVLARLPGGAAVKELL